MKIDTLKRMAVPTWNLVKNSTKMLRAMEDKGIWETIDVGVNLFESGKVWYNSYKHESKYTTMSKYEYLGNGYFADLLEKIIERCGLRIDSVEENGVLQKVLTGTGWVLHFDGTEDGAGVVIYLDGSMDEMRKELRKEILEKIGTNLFLDCINWELSCERVEVHTSGRLESIVERAKKYMNAGEGWSILMYGPPGTGKSTLARGLGQRLGISIMLRDISVLEDEGSSAQSAVLKLLDILDPEVFILEDMDHGGYNWRALLKFLEELQVRKKIIIGTANVLEDFNNAIIRPGRFDQLMKIEHMDKPTVWELVGGDEELYNIVAKHPIAYIKELMKRVKVLGKEEALKEVDDILARAEGKMEVEEKEYDY